MAINIFNENSPDKILFKRFFIFKENCESIILLSEKRQPDRELCIKTMMENQIFTSRTNKVNIYIKVTKVFYLGNLFNKLSPIIIGHKVEEHNSL